MTYASMKAAWLRHESGALALLLFTSGIVIGIAGESIQHRSDLGQVATAYAEASMQKDRLNAEQGERIETMSQRLDELAGRSKSNTAALKQVKADVKAVADDVKADPPKAKHWWNR